MDLGLHDKHAIVTGGSWSIGKAIARELAREGVDVAIVARNQGDLEATARELAAQTNRRIVPSQPMSPAGSRWTIWSRSPSSGC
jgi:short-subunit dehydrogenase